VRAFVGYEFVWEVELRIRKGDVPPARLDESRHLGWSTWLGGDGGGAFGYAVGMVFEPESALASRSNGQGVQT
jgi:type VI secretion system protein ImpH